MEIRNGTTNVVGSAPKSAGRRGKVSITRFLMGEKPFTAVVEAVEATVTWLQPAKLTGTRVADTPRRDDRVVAKDSAAPPLWACFYENGTNRPIFSGRDAVVRDRCPEIEQSSGHRRERGGFTSVAAPRFYAPPPPRFDRSCGYSAGAPIRSSPWSAPSRPDRSSSSRLPPGSPGTCPGGPSNC